jgi:hypothetical protein
LIQAIVTLNGVAVADGTGVAFSADFGVFAQNGSPSISVVTQKGTAVTALCSTIPGVAFVNATAKVGSASGKADSLKIVFQPTAQPLPFFSSCSPSSGPNTGGTTLVINGGRFPGDATTTRAMFTTLGITREAPVTAVTASSVTVMTPAFPEATSSSTPVSITLTFLNGSLTLSVPNCFAFGSVGTGTPNITAVIPSSGSKDGNTRVSIIGSGFSVPLQVFLSGGGQGGGSVECTVVSVSFNQVVILTPPAFNFGPTPPINSALDVRVHEVSSGLDATLKAAFTYVLPLQITGFQPPSMRTDSIGPLTVFGHGFRAPVIVTIGGATATVISVADSELQVLPSAPGACSGGGGAISVTNVSTGETATSSGSFNLVVPTISITSIFPTSGGSGTSVVITGVNLPTSIGNADVRVAGAVATVTATSADGTSITVTIPALAIPPPICPGIGTDVPLVVRSIATGCNATTTFTFTAPCVPATPTVTPTITPTLTPVPT